jgi:hypothetical protein
VADQVLRLRAGVVVKQPGLRIDDWVLAALLHVNDALVTGQDQRLFKHLVLDVAAVTDFELA